MRLFEDRAIYAPGTDPVAKIVLTVECNPGQEQSIIQHLSSVVTQAGVYCVELSGSAPEALAEVAPEPVAESAAGTPIEFSPVAEAAAPPAAPEAAPVADATEVAPPVAAPAENTDTH